MFMRSGATGASRPCDDRDVIDELTGRYLQRVGTALSPRDSSLRSKTKAVALVEVPQAVRVGAADVSGAGRPPVVRPAQDAVNPSLGA